MRCFKKQKAFSLIELVIVIVLLGILSISFSKILSQSVAGYMDARDRNDNSQAAKWIIEVISRSVREALPQSIRTASSGNQNCVEYMEIYNATTYFNLPASGIVSSFNVVTYDLAFQPNLSVAIMPVNASSIYIGNGVLTPINTVANSGLRQALITLDNPTNFTQRSPRNRVYILTTPTSYCLNSNSGQLTKYTNYGILGNQPSPPNTGNAELIAENFWMNGTVFNYQPGSLQRSGLLQLNFVAQNRDRYAAGQSESFEIFHEVHIRNVP